MVKFECQGHRVTSVQILWLWQTYGSNVVTKANVISRSRSFWGQGNSRINCKWISITKRATVKAFLLLNVIYNKVYSQLNFFSKWQLAEVIFKNSKTPPSLLRFEPPDLWLMRPLTTRLTWQVIVNGTKVCDEFSKASPVICKLAAFYIGSECCQFRKKVEYDIIYKLRIEFLCVMKFCISLLHV